MRKVAVLLSLLAATRAAAGQAKSCRVTLKGGSLDVGCLPALSARGTLVAVPVIDPDGDRGLPNLQVMFFPVDDRPPASTTVLTVAEVEELGGGQLSASLAEKIEPRLDLVNAQLSVPGFAPLRAIGFSPEGGTRTRFATDSGGLQLEVKNWTIEIGGRGLEPDTVPLPRPSRADCEAANAPFLRGMWASAGDGRDIVVRIDYKGSSTCPAPRPAWRVLRVRNAAASVSQPTSASQVKQASVLNTRAMRKFRAKDWSGAAADFRAAIESYSDHVKAHYNLACLASITQDRETALEQLRWLAASELPEAEARIVKARTDPDMSYIRNDPDARRILARSK